MMYAYLGYPLTFLTFLVMGIPIILVLNILTQNLLIGMLLYFLFGFSVSLIIQFYSLYILSPSTIKKSTIPWIIVSPVYEFMIMGMRIYLYILYLKGTGPEMKYGPNSIRALPTGSEILR